MSENGAKISVRSPSENFEIEKPKDSFWIVYILFFLLGLVHVLPWTFFVTAHDYWMRKFRNTTYDDVDSEHRTVLQTQFSPSLTITLQLSTIVFLVLTLTFGHKYSLKMKLFGPLTVILFSFIISAAFILVNTDSWQIEFFAFTMLIVAVINAMEAIFGMTAYSMLSYFSREYLGAYLNGEGMATIFTACLQVLSLVLGISTNSSALVYFWVAIGVIGFSLVLMGTIVKYNKFFRFNLSNLNKLEERKMISYEKFVNLFKEIWPGPAMMGLYILAVISVHTGITSLVVSEREGAGQWNDKYFVPVITFVLPAFVEYIGRVAAVKLKININAKLLVLFSCIRVIIFPPLLMLCNAQPRYHLPVVFSHDYQYIIIMVMFSLTNGYFVSTCSLIVPRLVSDQSKLEDAFHVFVVISGMLLGVLSFVSFVTVDII